MVQKGEHERHVSSLLPGQVPSLFELVSLMPLKLTSSLEVAVPLRRIRAGHPAREEE
jgi:hypothetical protein